jgi:hypothetical protein
VNKLRSLRQHILDACPDLKRDPDKLLTFVQEGTVLHTPRKSSLTHRQDYIATLVLTDFSGPLDAVTVPVLAWLETNQPDRANLEALQYEAEILDNDSVDLEIRIPLTESVVVTVNGDGTVTAEHIGEPVYVGDETQPDSLKEWELTHGF